MSPNDFSTFTIPYDFAPYMSINLFNNNDKGFFIPFSAGRLLYFDYNVFSCTNSLIIKYLSKYFFIMYCYTIKSGCFFDRPKGFNVSDCNSFNSVSIIFSTVSGTSSWHSLISLSSCFISANASCDLCFLL